MSESCVQIPWMEIILFAVSAGGCIVGIVVFKNASDIVGRVVGVVLTFLGGMFGVSYAIVLALAILEVLFQCTEQLLQ